MPYITEPKLGSQLIIIKLINCNYFENIISRFDFRYQFQCPPVHMCLILKSSNSFLLQKVQVQLLYDEQYSIIHMLIYRPNITKRWKGAQFQTILSEIKITRTFQRVVNVHLKLYTFHIKFNLSTCIPYIKRVQTFLDIVIQSRYNSHFLDHVLQLTRLDIYQYFR